MKQIKNNWTCGKCDQIEQKSKGEVIPKHFRTCPKRSRDDMLKTFIKEWDSNPENAMKNAMIWMKQDRKGGD